MYILKNIISTGCILYPLKFTCYNNLSWVTISEIKEISAAGEAWSKGISDLSASDKNKYLTYEDFNKNFNWVKAWSKKHLIVIIEILIPYLIFCFIIIFFILKKGPLKKGNLKKYYINLFIILLICNIIWFLKAPLYRYGYSLIISFLSISFALIILKFHLHKKKLFLISNFILIFGITILTTKNIYRIYENTNEYYNYPWPKYYSMNGENKKKNNFKVSYVNTQKIIIPDKGYCMYTKSLCNHYEIGSKLKLKFNNNYKVFFLLDEK